MENDKDEIRLDKTGSAANEDDMPGDNTIKTTDLPKTNLGFGSADNANLTQADSPDLDSSPDFANKETPGNTNTNDQ